ncbi:MAG: hypothetical protein PHQ43_14120 [Dehalococcoidales bacterium]|nr:hypothetical protein [Dehalococcoidales bacterium]
MNYTVSLTLTVRLDIPEGCEDNPDDNEIRAAAWKQFQMRYEDGDYDADSIDVEKEEEDATV